MDESSTTEELNNPDNAIGTQDSDASTDNQNGDADNLDASAEHSSEEDDSAGEGDGSGTSPHFDDDLDDWAEKRNGRKPVDEAERKNLQELRNSQREYTRTHQTKDKSDKLRDVTEKARPKTEPANDDGGDPLEKRLSKAESDFQEERSLRQRAEYLGQQEVSDEEVTVMGDILKEKVEKASTPEAKESAFKFWTDPANLQDWHDLAKARISRGGVDTKAIADKAAKEERARIAKESKANGSSRNAHTTSTGDKTADQARLERFKQWD